MDEAKAGLTYRDSGVDIAAGEAAAVLYGDLARRTRRPEVIGPWGGFGGFFALDPTRYREPVLVAGTDGVGTKLRLAIMLGRHRTVGIDLVAMCVNDILVHAAEPLFFLDYLGVGRLEPQAAAAIVEGVAEGCRQAGCALLGGETAEMPGFYQPGDYDLAGFAVGVVERQQLLDGRAVQEGDLVLGLAASGLHSNGYSLVRRVLLEEARYDLHAYFPELGRTLGEELLEPTRIYVASVLPILRRFQVHALAHITGGGIPGNLPRVLPPGVTVHLRKGSWPVPPIFTLIQQAGQVAAEEMYRVFNMGLGLLAIVPPDEASQIEAELAAAGETVYRVGEVDRGEQQIMWE